MDNERPSQVAKWNVVRVTVGHDRTVCLLGGDFVRLATHWFKGTFLCTDTPDCPACEVSPSRCYWYLPCLLRPHNVRGLLEMSAASSADLEQRAKMAGFPLGPGLEIRLERRSAKRPMRCEPLSQGEASRFVPLHEWCSGLVHIYGLTFMREGETLAEYGTRVANTVRTRAELKAAQIKAASLGRVQGRQYA